MSRVRRAAAIALVVVAPACGAAVGDPAPPVTVPPTAAPHLQVEDDDAVLVVGDSLTDGADRFGDLANRLEIAGFDDIEILAEVSRDVTWAIDEIVDLDAVPAVVVVELGTNPSADAAGFADAVAQLVAELRARGADRIAWLTPVHGRDDRYDEKVDVLAATLGIDVVADWADRVRDDPRQLAADGVHPTRDGYVELARFLVDTAVSLAAS